MRNLLSKVNVKQIKIYFYKEILKMIITRPFDINSIEDYQFTTKYHAAVVINC